MSEPDMLFINMKTGIDVLGYIKPMQRADLDEGMIISAKMHGSNVYYRVVGIEDDFKTKVYCKRIYVRPLDVIYLAIIGVLGYMVLKYYADNIPQLW